MKKEQFLNEIKEILLLNSLEINENTAIEIDSMSSLLLIAFLDENFSKTISTEKIKEIKKIIDIIDIVGSEKLI